MPKRRSRKAEEETREYVRAPIVTVLGHVNVGKTTLLDRIRGTAVAKREPGTITQHIGASFLPWSALEELAGPLASKIKVNIRIPGFLVIDTPGHEAFSNLRRRGGSIADIAILLVDVLKGFENQTYEALEILKSRRVPFIVAVNKIDRIPGWESHPGEPFVFSYRKQSPEVQARLEELLAFIIGQFRAQGFRADRYDRIRDFTRVVALIPISAATGEGVPDLLLVLAGLAQRYLINRLKVKEGPGKAVILELKEDPGLGMTAAAILYEGVLRRGDTIVVGGLEEPFVTRVKYILMPKPLDEMRSPEDRFMSVDEIKAAAGVKVVAEGLEKSVAGAPLYVVEDESRIEDYLRMAKEEVAGLRIQRDIAGVVVKADTLGTLEALVEYLRRHDVPVRYADVGPVVRRDVIEAQLVKNVDPKLAAILAFNVKATPDAREEAKASGIPIFTERIIYRLVEDYLEWYKKQRELERRRILEKMTPPAVIQILPGYVFRRRDPIIVGIRVVTGKLRGGVPLITRTGRKIGEVMQIQEHEQPLEYAEEGMEVAVSIRSKAIVGRQVKEGDYLYSDVPVEEINTYLDKLADELSEGEKQFLQKLLKFKLGFAKEIEYP